MDIHIQTILVFLLIIIVGYISGNYTVVEENRLVLRRGERRFLTPSVYVIIILITLLSGLRFDLGTDYLGYLDDYTSGVEAAGRGHEFLFHYISKIFYDLKIHPVIYFGLWAFIQITLFLYAFKDYKKVYPYLILFLILNGTYDSWMNGIRQEIASCIWLCSLIAIEKRKFWLYFVFLIVEYCFHRSSVFLILMYPFLTRYKSIFDKIPVQIVFLVIAFAIRFFLGSSLSSLDRLLSLYTTYLGGDAGLYEHYDASSIATQIQNRTVGTGMAYIFKFLIYLSIILQSDKIKSFFNSDRFNVFYVLFFLGVLFEYMFPDGAINLRRPFMYFTVFLTIMLAFYLYYLRKKKNFILLFVVVVGYFGLFFINRWKAPLDVHMMFNFYFQSNIINYYGW